MAGAERRLAAIWFSDIVGYTALMAADEAAGLRARARHRSLLRSLAGRHHGKIVDENGDELVALFPSGLDAVACALAAQASLREDRDLRLREDRDLRLRIGLHLGDVILEGGRVYGDGVNVASRIRPLADAGSVAISEPVFDSVKGQAGLELAPLGTHTLKNVERPLAIYAVTGNFETPGGPARLRGPAIRRAVIGVGLAAAAAVALYLAREWQVSQPATVPALTPTAGSLERGFDDGQRGHVTTYRAAQRASVATRRVARTSSTTSPRFTRGQPVSPR